MDELYQLLSTNLESTPKCLLFLDGAECWLGCKRGAKALVAVLQYLLSHTKKLTIMTTAMENILRTCEYLGIGQGTEGGGLGLELPQKVVPMAELDPTTAASIFCERVDHDISSDIREFVSTSPSANASTGGGSGGGGDDDMPGDSGKSGPAKGEMVSQCPYPEFEVFSRHRIFDKQSGGRHPGIVVQLAQKMHSRSLMDMADVDDLVRQGQDMWEELLVNKAMNLFTKVTSLTSSGEGSSGVGGDGGDFHRSLSSERGKGGRRRYSTGRGTAGLARASSASTVSRDRTLRIKPSQSLDSSSMHSTRRSAAPATRSAAAGDAGVHRPTARSIPEETKATASESDSSDCPDMPPPGHY